MPAVCKQTVLAEVKYLNDWTEGLLLYFNSHERYKIDEVLNEMQVKASESDIAILKQVCAAVSKRAARLAAGGLATIVKVSNLTRIHGSCKLVCFSKVFFSESPSSGMLHVTPHKTD